MINNEINEKDIADAIKYLQSGKKVTALLAPAIEKMLSTDIKREEFYSVLKKAGFHSWKYVSSVVDVLIQKECYEWNTLDSREKILLSPSCPVVTKIIKEQYPELMKYLSKMGSPMYLASLEVKEAFPEAVTVFIGPCPWKKEERAADVQGKVDIVLTIREFLRLLSIMNLNLQEYSDSQPQKNMKKEVLHGSGKLAHKVQMKLQESDETNVPEVLFVSGLKECQEILERIRKGEICNHYIEIMACKNGCSGSGQF